MRCTSAGFAAKYLPRDGATPQEWLYRERQNTLVHGLRFMHRSPQLSPFHGVTLNVPLCSKYKTTKNKFSRMVYMKHSLTIFMLALVLLALPMASQAQVSVGISVHVAPPVLPVYVQPPCP